MELYDFIEQSREDLIRDLQGCIQIPSVEARDGSGYPYEHYDVPFWGVVFFLLWLGISACSLLWVSF